MEPAGSRVPVSLLMAMVISFSPSALSPLSCKQPVNSPAVSAAVRRTAHSRVRVLFVFFRVLLLLLMSFLLFKTRTSVYI